MVSLFYTVGLLIVILSCTCGGEADRKSLHDAARRFFFFGGLRNDGLLQIPQVPPFGAQQIITTTVTKTEAQANATASGGGGAINIKFVINAGLSFVPPRGWFKVPNLGCAISDDDRFFAVFINNKGTPVVFTSSGKKIRVFADSNGIPVAFSHHRIFLGFAIINGVGTGADSFGPWFVGRYELSVLGNSSFKTFPRFVRTCKVNIKGRIPCDDVWTRSSEEDDSDEGKCKKCTKKPTKCAKKKCKKDKWDFDDSSSGSSEHHKKHKWDDVFEYKCSH
uniref:LAM_G_DOMAIN domain-containing protein n=1 Tax=Rhabditophanes sp. KR3021 TaxID=114890 RepID=A0AC35TJW9_9BILA